MKDFDYKEFIRRTKKALAQYEAYIKEHPKEQSYLRTLFINACLGLLMVPREEIMDFLPKDSINTWGIDENIIKIEKDKSIQKIVTHLRNAVAHSRFEYNCQEISVPIEEITFTDKNNKLGSNNNFEVTLDYNTFKDFVLKLAEFALEYQN